MPLRRNAERFDGLTLSDQNISDGGDGVGVKPLLDNSRHRPPTKGNERRTNTRELRFWIANDFGQARRVVSILEDVWNELGCFTKSDSFRVILALEEALANAIVHGNLEIGSNMRDQDDGTYEELMATRLKQPPFQSRRVRVAATFTTHQTVFEICDEGKGFDVSALPDPTAEDRLSRSHGRGLLLIQSLVDEVRYNECGNQITLVKWRSDTEQFTTTLEIR